MAKYKYIRADIYKRGITVFIGSRKELTQFVKIAFKDLPELVNAVAKSEDSTALGTTFLEEFGQSLIWLPKLPKTPDGIANLAHEILHATFALLDYIGVEYVPDSPNEAYTYLSEFFLYRALLIKGYKDFKC